MFCSCKNDPDEEKPNANICPICLGHPGTLPVLNHEAIRHVLKVGVAVNGKLADFTEWDRKNYFYPDIPKGYQISQYKYPLVSDGELAGVALERVHLEEDTASSVHDASDKTLINFNRSGVPLMELVTKPVIHDAATAVRFAKELQLLLRYLGAGDANMEKGEMRVEANISVMAFPDSDSSTRLPGTPDFRPSQPATSADFRGAKRSETKTLRRGEEGENQGGVKLGTKTEVKNLNSFRAVEDAINYEVARQTALLENGETVIQETRGWDDGAGETFSQRSKESSHDYRYFPDPDIPKMEMSDISEFSSTALKGTLPELPWAKRDRYKKDFGMTDKEVAVFVESPEIAKYYEEVVTPFMSDAKKTKLATNYILSDYLGMLKRDLTPALSSKEERGHASSLANKYTEDRVPPSLIEERDGARSEINTIPPFAFSELIEMIANNEISSRGAKDLIALLVARSPASNEEGAGGRSVKELAKKHGLLQQSNAADIEPAILKVIADNASVVEEYKKGKTASLQFLIGQAMKATKGAANPGVVKEILLKMLG